VATVCFSPYNVPIVRVTQLDSCGLPVTGDCSQVVSEGIISVEMTKEYEDRVDLFKKNGDGVFCFKKTIPPILKWINLVMTFCNVDPELTEIVTGNPVYLSDAPTPDAIGYSTEENTAFDSNFAFEAWTRLGNTGTETCVTGGDWGYRLYPWVVEGTVGDITLENDMANFVLNARTQSGSPWGVGPYYVGISQATATAGNPKAMNSAIGSSQHERVFVTQMPPPEPACGCQSLVGSLTVTGTGGFGVSATVPTDWVGEQVYVDWGDGNFTRTPTAGTTATHTYSGAGTYTVRMTRIDVSSAGYTGSVTV
jgi:hypothetical protein